MLIIVNRLVSKRDLRPELAGRAERNQRLLAEIEILRFYVMVTTLAHFVLLPEKRFHKYYKYINTLRVALFHNFTKQHSVLA
jgi:hypothetical protein